MTTFEDISKHYGLPTLRRGMMVRWVGKHTETGVIVAPAKNHYLRTSMRKQPCYVFDLDYLVDGEWVLGEDLQQNYDELIDGIRVLIRQNRRQNRF